MIIIINKVKIHSKPFCEKFVTGSNLRERVRSGVLTPAISHRPEESSQKYEHGRLPLHFGERVGVRGNIRL